MALTMKLGALPLWRLAAMKTEPAEMAANVVASGPIHWAGSPPVRLEKSRTVAALSRKDNNTPANQK